MTALVLGIFVVVTETAGVLAMVRRDGRYFAAGFYLMALGSMSTLMMLMVLRGAR